MRSRYSRRIVPISHVWSYGPTDADLTRPFHEVVEFKNNIKILKIDDNRLDMKVESGQGTLRISDIVVWFQNKV